MRGLLIVLVSLGCSAGPGSSCTSDRECGTLTCLDGRCVAGRDAGAFDAGRSDAGRDAGRVSLDAPMCMVVEPDEITCNALDDDCDGYIDDVDVGGDGICDCLNVGVIGDPGVNASSSFQVWLEARGTTVVRFGLDAAELTSAQLAPYDIIVLDRLRRDYTTAEADALRAFVEAGGGVMVMTGYTGGGEDYTRPNTLLAPFGVAYVGGLHDGPVTSFQTHPLTAGLSSVTFAGGYLIDGPGTVVANLAGGTAGIAIERGMGRVFVWGDEWIQFDSEWSTMPMIERLWTNIFSWLGPRDSCVIII